MRLLTFVILLGSVSSTAFAADAPNIVGTWIPVSFVTAHAGIGGELPDSDRPIFSNDPATAWALTIDAQDGAAFSGSSKGTSGSSGMIVGVFRLDGKRFVTSTVRGSAAGELMGDRLEICWTDNIPDFIGASCTVYKRQ